MGLNNQGWKWKGEEPWKLETGGSKKDEILAISDKGSKIIQINWKKTRTLTISHFTQVFTILKQFVPAVPARSSGNGPVPSTLPIVSILCPPIATIATGIAGDCHGIATLGQCSGHPQSVLSPLSVETNNIPSSPPSTVQR